MPNEALYRFSAFCLVFLLVAAGEIVAPRRPLTTVKSRRWLANFGIIAIDNFAIRLFFPLLPVGVAILAAERGWGVLNLVALSEPLKIVLAVIALDFVIYLQHVLFHFLPHLWRLHRMHHTDLDLDVTSATRFHPFEIFLSLGIKLGAVVFLGAPPLAVLIFEITLNATAMFSHGNLAIPAPVDRWLRLFLVTPDMHRVHHSIVARETNSNFGFCLPWWDRLCGTYRAAPEAGQLGMTIGLKEYRDPARLSLGRLLIQPFTKP